MKRLSIFELRNSTRYVVDRYFIDNNFEIEKIEMIETTQSQVITYKLKSIIEERITCVFNRNGILSMIEF